MADVKETLRRLVGEVQDCGCDVTDVVEMNYVENDVLIDHLIANGVEVPVRCKGCKWYRRDCEVDMCWCTRWSAEFLIHEEHFCSYGKRRTE